MNVLIIEDNVNNLYLAQYLLEASGHSVVSAHNGASGIVLTQQQDFDVILLDIQLPDINGHEVARRLTTLPDWSGAPIIAVTSFALSGDREKALAAGCTAYLEKPIDPEQFVAQITHILKAHVQKEGSCRNG